MKKTGAEILWECMVREGVEVAFGYPGGAIMPVHDAMLNYPVHHVLTRHEQGAAHAADGYPGTPSSEVMDGGLSQIQDMIKVGWSVNESVAVGVGFGSYTRWRRFCSYHEDPRLIITYVLFLRIRPLFPLLPAYAGDVQASGRI